MNLILNGLVEGLVIVEGFGAVGTFTPTPTSTLYVLVNPKGQTFAFADATPGAAGSALELNATQGYDYSAVIDLDITYGSFDQTAVLSAVLWSSPYLTSVGSPTAGWFTAGGTQTGYTQGQVQFTIPGSLTAGLDPAGEYGLDIVATYHGSQILVARSLVFISPSPSSVAFTGLAPLASVDFVRGILAGSTVLTPQQSDALPEVVNAASGLFRVWCNRTLTQGIYVEQVPVEWNGEIRLREPPINWMVRIQSTPRVAITISNATADAAWVAPIAMGDQYIGVTITGLTLWWESGGLTNSFPITFAANETITTLASAVSAAGSGWTATPDTVLGALPVTELFDLQQGRGAGPNDQPNGAAYNVYSQTVTNQRPNPDDGERTGIWWVGRRGWGGFDPSWGPGAEEFANYGYGTAGTAISGRVKVTYNGGYTTIPYAIQAALAELVKANFRRLMLPDFLKSESDGSYSYTVANEMISNLPQAVRMTLALYRSTNA